MASEVVRLPYGSGSQTVEVPKDKLVGTFLPRKILVPKDPDAVIRDALSSPIGSPSLREVAKGHEEAVILISDITRPVPSNRFLPPLLEELEAAGLGPEHIRIVIATGLHRCHTDGEKRRLVGDEVAKSIRVEDHSPDACVSLGTTAGGLPIEINRTVLEADLRICTGNIDPHYFVGYSGGSKAIMPGVSSLKSITATHSMMLLPGAEVGNINGNPVRAAIDEIGEDIGVHFIFNVILNEDKQIVGAVAGHHVNAHREGCKIADSMFKVHLPQPADIVIVSAGGYPKDINLYQAQKALDNARLAVKENGVIILVAECREGFGEETFEEWMTSADSPDVIIGRMQERFVMGGHKALAVAQTMKKARIMLVSSIHPDLVRQAMFEASDDVQDALRNALNSHKGEESIVVLPYGGSTIPTFEG
jgi:nickel-dependent lactate racemase